jgi:putative tryptophan/tyrosine transport system substrate-binding protein
VAASRSRARSAGVTGALVGARRATTFFASAATWAAGRGFGGLMDRRAFIGTLGLLAAPFAIEAQQAGRVFRIGWLNVSGVASYYSPFRERLRELGWVEGRDVVIEYRSAEGRVERLPALAADLVRLKVDVIVAGGAAAPREASKATATIPIVMTSGGDPVAAGLVASLARPGGNVTGLATISPELSAKRLELLKEAVPGLRRVAVFWNPANPNHGQALRAAEGAARTLGLELEPLEFRVREHFEGAFRAAKRAHSGAVVVLDDPVTLRDRNVLVSQASNIRLPVMYGFRESAEAGGLIAFGPNLADLNRRAATFVDRILKGAKPGDLPVEQPTKFELVINLRTAKALGLTIPQSLLQRADHVIA